MLEALTQETLRAKLRFETGADGGPSIASVADAARACVRAWRSPARARVTAYLHRQFLAAGFDEDLVRARVADVVNALIEIGDVTPVRLSGKTSLVLSRRQWIRIADDDLAFLGLEDADTPTTSSALGYARRTGGHPPHYTPIDFVAFMGTAGYRRHLARRTSGTGDGALSEFWSTLSATLRHDGQPLDPAQVRAVIDPPGTHDGRFGRYNLPMVSGRWKTDLPDGTWCAARPGRHANEWHPILSQVTGSEIQSMDLFDWDEWNWALLARGVAIGAPERAAWNAGTLSFEHPVPAQFQRAMRLLARPGQWQWTWTISEEANEAFSRWRDAAL